jgi:hypothetical protein
MKTRLFLKRLLKVFLLIPALAATGVQLCYLLAVWLFTGADLTEKSPILHKLIDW